MSSPSSCCWRCFCTILASAVSLAFPRSVFNHHTSSDAQFCLREKLFVIKPRKQIHTHTYTFIHTIVKWHTTHCCWYVTCVSDGCLCDSDLYWKETVKLLRSICICIKVQMIWWNTWFPQWIVWLVCHIFIYMLSNG